MLDGTVTKDYLEDVAGPGEGDWAYHWWEYTFDFQGVRYRARVYTEEPARAYVLQLTNARSGDPDLRHVLAFIHAKLADDGVTELATLGSERGYEVVPPDTYSGSIW